MHNTGGGHYKSSTVSLGYICLLAGWLPGCLAGWLSDVARKTTTDSFYVKNLRLVYRISVM